MRNSNARGGYSLIELAILMVCISLLGVFIVLSQSMLEPPPEVAEQRYEQRDVDQIRTGIGAYAAESVSTGRNPIFPIMLDGAPIGVQASDDIPLFTSVHPQGVRDEWHKVGVNRYYYGQPVTTSDADQEMYFYEPQSGRFVKGIESGPTQAT
jgi:hypothetical protein